MVYQIFEGKASQNQFYKILLTVKDEYGKI